MTQGGQHRHLLPGTALEISRLGFGTASLHHLPAASDRRALLEAAMVQGLTHFDTAPLYGFGLAERDLAPLLAAEPSLTVATKVGLYAPGGSDQSSTRIILRKALGKLYPPLSRAKADYSVKKAEASFSASLARLRRERVEILFIHEPNPALIQSDEWQAWLAREKTRGRLRAIGLAGARPGIEPFIHGRKALAEVVQAADSLDDRESDFLLEANRPLQITYGYLSAAARSGKPFDPHDVLVKALRRNRTGTILVSTRHTGRMKIFASALDAAREEA